MSISRDNKNSQAEQEWDLDKYPDVADWSDLKKKDLIDMLEDDIFGLYGLLSVCDVVILDDDPDIKTACLTLTASPKIFLNRKFLNKFCPSRSNILMVLMHELYHKILNHAGLFKSYKKEDLPLLNVATDAFINALLYQLYPDDKYSSFFRDFYNQLVDEKKQENPSYDGHPFHLLKSKSKIPNFRIRNFYQGLYSPFGQDLDSIIKLCRETIPKQHCQYVQGIGDHSGQSGEIHEHLRKEVTKIAQKAHKTLRDQAEEYKKMLEARKKAEEEARKKQEEKEGKGKTKGKKKEEGQKGERYADEFDPDNREKNQDYNIDATAFVKYMGGVVEMLKNKDKTLQSNMIKMAKQSIESKVIIKTKSMFPSIPGKTVRPNFKDKGGLIAYSMGRYKPFYKNPLLPQDFGQCAVYIDVSGSMGSYIDNIYTVLNAPSLRDLLLPHIYLFSTYIATITKKELKNRVIDTGGGTDFDIIFDHMVKNNHKKAIFFTDGYGGVNQKSKDLINKHKIKMITVFTPDRSTSNPLWEVSESCFTFNEHMRVEQDDMTEYKKNRA